MHLSIPLVDLQPRAVCMAERIAAHMVEPIPPSRQSDRIRLRVPPGLRVVLAEPVVMHFRLRVEVLARVAQVELEFALDWRDGGESSLRDGGRCLAEGGERPLPQQRAIGVHDATWRVPVVGHDGLDGRVVLHRGHGHRPGGRRQPDVLTRARAQGAARAVLAHERAVLVVDIGVAQAIGLAGGASGCVSLQADEKRREARACLYITVFYHCFIEKNSLKNAEF